MTTLVTVTESAQVEMLVCEWCGVKFPRPSRRGPPPQYCSVGHKQRAYEDRRAAIPPSGTPEHDVWVAAIEIATYPPVQMTGVTTLVPARLVRDLRAALDDSGVDWHAGKT